MSGTIPAAASGILTEIGFSRLASFREKVVLDPSLRASWVGRDWI